MDRKMIATTPASIAAAMAMASLDLKEERSRLLVRP
jgi:hypothetical protein